VTDPPSPDAKRIARRLEDLREFAEDARYTVSLGLDAFLEDSPDGRILRNNGRHILIQVATVVEKLPVEFKQRYADIDWVAISRMRNLIAHHYDKVDDQLIYAALATRIPALIARLDG
jgi:uncharacterized protein with HEPN domain